ncbi:MAG: serine/threonine-protein phosphatase [Acidobacteria bacterium]|nr:serine/threonine-protein phosphatase [Acidobacteriota bacterium]
MTSTENNHDGSDRKNTGGPSRWIRDLFGSDLQRTFHRDVKALYGFYIDEERRRELAQMNSVKRFFMLLGWMFKSLYGKLSPVRQLMLVISLALILWGNHTFAAGGIRISLNLTQIGALLLLLILMLELKDKLLARDELEVGRAVQLSLLPEHNPDLPGWEIWLYTEPANDVGGDLVDYLETGPDRLSLILGDVSGKGLGAALLMAKLQATVRALAAERPTMVDLGRRINEIFCRDGLPGRFATMVYLELLAGTATVRLLNAGHIPPVVIRHDRLDVFSPVALPMGILADTTFQDQATDLQAGDVLLLYSDGVTEATNDALELYDDDRLFNMLPQLRPFPPETIGRRILESVNAFVQDAPRSDDLSMIILKKL